MDGLLPYLLVLVIVRGLVCFVFIHSTVSLLTQLAEKRLSSFSRALGLEGNY
ncbi:hypothetical protein L228DRAFT_247056 [Xylona heveae TC161]|uniref:Uncharacterized protein n=1 Tax=Xylona heveae (strain CBS 132557 / TC161) TaxID=1328760 RepID=A0A165GWK6_XYLHT|nr:hypothetical protein L228DRAFT_247056 [Xylona heveae TC161]KZF22690.1 hypothetical protein L228DRAFT_247056 [Xylona heveae TC161]